MDKTKYPKITLNNSGVDFYPKEHRYFLNGKELNGITGVLSNQLGYDYNNVPTRYREEAAERGKAIHSAIELYYKGMKSKSYETFIDDFVSLTAAQSLCHVTNEYLVTDFNNFASAIDVVFVKENGHVVLGDIKTTSTLKVEKVRWQLSIYAYMFNLLNPDIIIDDLIAIWLPTRKTYGKAKIQSVEQIPREECIKLLECEINGTSYQNNQLLANTENESKLAVMVEAFQDEIIDCTLTAKEANDRVNEMKDKLKIAFESFNIKSLKNEFLSLTYVEEHKQSRFDTAKFQQDYPELYAQYVKESNVKSSLKININ